MYVCNVTLEMNKFTENECLPNFEPKFKFLDNLRKPLTLKSMRKHRKKNKMAETREEGRSVAKENQTGINADELASFRDNIGFKKTLKKV